MMQFGLIGSGFVAQKRADALAQDRRGKLVAVSSHTVLETTAFAEKYGVEAVYPWQELVCHPAVDVVMVCHVNRDHGVAAAAALAAGKHVVVEYPLAFQTKEAQAILALAKTHDRLLHVEHIELLGGVHRALKEHLATVGEPQYASYRTLSPRRPAPANWTYHPELFGFPLVGALSRIHRLVDSFGPVAQVYCQNRYDGLDPATGRYTSCTCVAHLTFQSGLFAEVVYGKGDQIWYPERRLSVSGGCGGLILDPDGGQFIGPANHQPVAVGSRRGLFAADTRRVLDYLLEGVPLYCTPETSLYALQVAEAAQESAMTGQVVRLATGHQESR